MTACEEFPAELSIVAHRGGWRLLFHGRADGSVFCRDRGLLERIADGYAQARREAGPGSEAYVQMRREAATAAEAFWAPGGLR